MTAESGPDSSIRALYDPSDARHSPPRPKSYRRPSASANDSSIAITASRRASGSSAFQPSRKRPAASVVPTAASSMRLKRRLLTRKRSGPVDTVMWSWLSPMCSRESVRGAARRVSDRRVYSAVSPAPAVASQSTSSQRIEPSFQVASVRVWIGTTPPDASRSRRRAAVLSTPRGNGTPRRTGTELTAREVRFTTVR